jgi:hypothetical protein
MNDIEPDLVSKGLAQLDTKYKDETPEQIRDRTRKYYRAFQEFEQRVKTSKIQTVSSIKTFCKDALAYLESLSKIEDERLCLRLADSFS